MEIRPVSQLSAPRDVKLTDELSGRPATLKRVLLGQEYLYADMESLELDATVLDEIGPLLAQIAGERGASGTSDERAIHAAKLHSLLASAVKATRSLAERRLLEKDYIHANPAALRCLKLSLELYGSGSIDLIPSYLLLSEACLGLERPAQSDEFLSMAELAVTGAGADGAPPAMVARLHMLKGKVCFLRGDYSAALRSFAKNVYYTTQALENPEHYGCGPGLYQLGRTFAAQGRWEQALASYDKCVDVWYKSLLGVKGSMARKVRELVEEEARQQGKALPPEHPEEEAGSGAGAGAEGSGDRMSPVLKGVKISRSTGLPRLGTVEADEAVEMLASIEGVRTERLGQEHVSVAEVQYTRALVLAAKKDLLAALPLLEGAVQALVAKLGPDHPTSADASSFLSLLQQLQARRMEAIMAGTAGSGMSSSATMMMAMAAATV